MDGLSVQSQVWLLDTGRSARIPGVKLTTKVDYNTHMIMARYRVIASY